MKTIALPFAAALALGASTAALAQDFPARTIIVSGVGETTAAPDMATLSIGVETQARTAAEALRLNGQRMRATMDKLKSSGVADRDMQTQNLSVSPRYNYEENRASPRIIGYTATNMLNVKLRDLDKAGAIIDEAVSDGANRLGGLYFGFAEPEPLMNEARKAAVVNAREKASLYAAAAGVTLGPLVQLQDGYSMSPPPQPYMDVRVMAARAESTPVSAGESTITANVTLVYEIK